MHEDYDSLLPPTLAAQRVGVSRQLLHYWCRTGRLTPADRVNGRPLFRLGDVLAVEAAMRAAPRSRRARVTHGDDRAVFSSRNPTRATAA